MEDEQTERALSRMFSYLLDNMKPLDPEMVQIVNDNFWELLLDHENQITQPKEDE